MSAREKRICGAKRSDGGVCQNQAGYGTDHLGFGQCKRHMGCTPGPSRGAFREMARAMGDPIKIHPAEAMASQIANTAGHVAWLEDKVASFRFGERTKLDEDGVEVEIFMTPNQQSWWKIYQEERDRLVRYSEVAIKAGLAERTVRLAEAQGEMLAQAIDRILSGLGLTDEQLQRVPDVVPAVLRQLAIERPAIEAG